MEWLLNTLYPFMQFSTIKNAKIVTSVEYAKVITFEMFVNLKCSILPFALFLCLAFNHFSILLVYSAVG